MNTPVSCSDKDYYRRCLNEKFREEDNPIKIYAISMSWFKEWENFVRIKTDNPPGPIDNRGICITRNKHDVLRPNSDYGQLSEEMWSYLYETYGGGPELVIQYSVSTATPNPTSQPAGLSSSSSNQMLNQSANAAVSSPRGVQSSLPQTGSMVPDEAEIQSTVNTEAQSKAEAEAEAERSELEHSTQMGEAQELNLAAEDNKP